MAIAGVGYGSITAYYPNINNRTGTKTELQKIQTERQCSGDITVFERPTDDDLEKAEYLDSIRQWRDMQYSVGNMVGYHKAANVCNALVNLHDEQNGTVKQLEGTEGIVRVSYMEGTLKSGIIGLSSFGTGDNFHLLEAGYADDSTTDNPIIKVRISDESGANKEFKVNINDIDPRNATQLEMFALCSYAETHGISDLDKNCCSYKTLADCAFIGGYEESDIADFVEKKQDWVEIVDKAEKYGKNGKTNVKIADMWIQMLKNLFEAFQENTDLSDESVEDDSASDEQEKHFKETDVFSNNIGLPPKEQTLTDERYTDDESGISWYVGKDGSSYMLEEDKEKLISLCNSTGENWLRKLEQMTGFAFHHNADE